MIHICIPGEPGNEAREVGGTCKNDANNCKAV